MKHMGDLGVRTDITSNDKKVTADCSSLTTKSVCSVSVSAPFAVSSNLSPVLEGLQECLLLLFCYSSAASQPSQASIVARVLAAHTRSPSFSRNTMSTFPIDVY